MITYHNINNNNNNVLLGAEISTVDPEHYGKRFLEFIDNHVK